MRKNVPASNSTSAAPTGARRGLLWIATGALACGLLVGGLLTLGARRADVGIAPCADRAMVVGLSSSERSGGLEHFAIEAVSQGALSAAVCGRTLEAFGVAGGGQVAVLLSSDDVAQFTPAGPNRAVRLARLDPHARSAIETLVADRFRRAYAADRAPSVSSVVALYAVAAEHVGPRTDLVVVTDGVNHDGQVDLNRPLQAGDGQRLVDAVAVPRVGDHVTTVVGIAQVDATIPAPSPTWPAEVRAFNATVCRRSGAARCRLFSVASVADALTG